MNTHKSMYDHFTDGVSPNETFVRALRKRTRTRPVTNRDGYEVYAEFCAKKKYHWSTYGPNRATEMHEDMVNDYWLQMNVRNQMCKLEYFGILIRDHPGKFHWNPLLAKYDEDGIIDLYRTQQRAALRRRDEMRKRLAELEKMGYSYPDALTIMNQEKEDRK